jgi:hypothetical protein
VKTEVLAKKSEKAKIFVQKCKQRFFVAANLFDFRGLKLIELNLEGTQVVSFV